MTLIVPKAARDGYRRHAAPESVQASLAIARRRLAEAQEEADWLEVLLARKLALFRANGTWMDCDGRGKSCDHPHRAETEKG
jgi:hypothetical protein